MFRFNGRFVPLMVFFLFAVLPPAAPALAEVYQLPDISVTATRSEQELAKLPRNVTVITREEIETLNPLTVTDVLQSVPGLVIRDYSGTGSSATVDMRGFGETGNLHTLVTVDGRRLNQIDLSGVDFTTIPVENIERIEILHGPAGVIYGDSAVGGVINIITKEGSGPFSGKVQTSLGSYDFRGVKANVQGAAGKVSYFVSARQDATDGYRDNSETRLSNVTFNTRIYPTDTLSFLLDGAFNQADFSLPGSLSEAQMEENRRQASSPEDWAENKDSSVRGQVKKDFGGAGVLTADLSYRWRDSSSRMWARYDTDINTLGFQPKYVVNGHLAGLGHRLTLGLDVFRTGMTNDTSAIGGPKQQTMEYELDTMGLYLLEELNLTEKLVFSLGGRHQQARYDITSKPVGAAESSNSSDEDQSAVSAGLSYNFTQGSKVYGRVSRSFRYPTVEEYVTYGIFNDLKPEKIVNCELGVEYTFMPGGRLSVAVYRMEVEDEIAYNPATWLNENLDETRHTGVEASLRVPLGEIFSVYGTAALQEACFTKGDYDGKRLPLVPDWLGSVGLDVKPVENLRAGLQFNFVGERPYGSDKANDYGDLPAYTTVDFNLDYKISRFHFFFNAKNILGEKYSTYAYASAWGKSYYPDPEASFWGGVGVDF